MVAEVYSFNAPDNTSGTCLERFWRKWRKLNPKRQKLVDYKGLGSIPESYIPGLRRTFDSPGLPPGGSLISASALPHYMDKVEKNDNIFYQFLRGVAAIFFILKKKRKHHFHCYFYSTSLYVTASILWKRTKKTLHITIQYNTIQYNTIQLY